MLLEFIIGFSIINIFGGKGERNEGTVVVNFHATPVYFDNLTDNEIHFLVELHYGQAFCCKRLTLEKRWEITLMGDYPEGLAEMACGVIGGTNSVELLREAPVDVQEL